MVAELSKVTRLGCKFSFNLRAIPHIIIMCATQNEQK